METGVSNHEVSDLTSDRNLGALNGVRGFWVNGGPIVMLSGFDGVDDVGVLEEAVLEVVNTVMDQAEAHPEVVQEADHMPESLFDDARDDLVKGQ